MWKVKLIQNVEEFRRSKLLEKYIAKILFGWDNRKFKDKYVKKLERNYIKGKRKSSFSREEILKRRVILEL